MSYVAVGDQSRRDEIIQFVFNHFMPLAFPITNPNLPNFRRVVPSLHLTLTHRKRFRDLKVIRDWNPIIVLRLVRPVKFWLFRLF